MSDYLARQRAHEHGRDQKAARADLPPLGTPAERRAAYLAFDYAYNTSDPGLTEPQRRRLDQALRQVWRQGRPRFRDDARANPAVLAVALRAFGIVLEEADGWAERFLGALNAEWPE